MQVGAATALVTAEAAVARGNAGISSATFTSSIGLEWGLGGLTWHG